ncbi:MAG: cyclic pyranopterin monophosphate synthase MoaC [bacterium]
MFSHVDDKNKPAMVNVGGKPVTHRVARARAIVAVPPEVLTQLDGAELQSRKGPVFQTAILAGIMGAKKTSELIPLCHPLGLEDCKVEIAVNDRGEIVIECRAELHGKTGVEMEALTGATIAALTVYDMCKALSHDSVIKEIRLLEKRGGKKDFARS